MTALILAAILAQLEGDNKPPEPEKINRAIERGVEALLRMTETDGGHPFLKADELVLYALTYVDKTNDPRVKRLLDRILKTDLNAGAYPTYSVAVRAMALTQIDPVKHQLPIAQCAWWLVQAQTDNGQWDYWSIKEQPPASFPRGAWPGKTATGESRKAETGLIIKRTAKWADRPVASIDKVLRNTSTAQYAILGLWAAYRSKVWIPPETWDRTLKGVLSGQLKSGGWGYIHPEDKANSWKGQTLANRSMTASQLSVLAVLKGVLETPPRDIDTAMHAGFEFLARDPDLKPKGAFKGPIDGDVDSGLLYYYYWLYSVERAGILWGREKIGNFWWYAQGANQLLRLQNQDGSWGQDFENATDKPANTAFAILFLKRAVPPPVATGGKD
jgi:hypothetical protein